jgi:hypothetical protein
VEGLFRKYFAGICVTQEVSVRVESIDEAELGGILQREIFSILVMGLPAGTDHLRLGQDLSKWMLELPPQTRVKDVFYRNTSERDPLTGQLIQSSTPITPLTIILEQYRDMDKKIVEYHLRNEKALGEFDQELRSSLENGLKGLMDVEAMGLVPKTESRHPSELGSP